MMKRDYLLFLFVISAMMAQAGITTYQFTGVKWTSQVGAAKCDGKTDGWVSDKDDGAYDVGRIWADQSLHGAGVGVQTGQSGAGATSVKSFTKVRQIKFNLCQNSSNKGQGVIYVQIGDSPIDSIVMTNQNMTASDLNRDSTIRITTEKSGKIRFWIKCTKNAIYINTITIRAEEGGSNPFTEDSYQLVTDRKQLQDSDQIIFGVTKGNYIMGYFDNEVNKNNIPAIKGNYSTDRQTVGENDAAVYTLWLMQEEQTGDSFYVFVDEIRYEQAFLVASGGATKNRLALWGDYTSPVYGDYGVWDVTVQPNGEATIESMGTSAGKYMQLNSGNATGPIFACYSNLNYDKICLYRRVSAIGDKAAIVAPMCNFGVTALSDDEVSGSKTIQVNANKLTEDITCTFKHGDVFSLGTTTIDRDGDELTIRYRVTEAGKYTDTLVLTSGSVSAEVLVLLDVKQLCTIAEAVQSDDYDFVYLNPVVVTKKYSQYVFIRDETGSMLIWDATDPKTGKPYAQGLEQGHVLSNVQGRFKNYYGVPEITPTSAWTVAAQKKDVSPETVMSVDSADVCRYVQMTGVTVENGLWQGIPVVDAFLTGVIASIPTTLDAIVMIDHDETQLWVVKQIYSPTDVNQVYDKTPSQCGKYIRKGRLYFLHTGHIYNANGQTIK
ncbi:MAG: hypothetical protein MJZ64_05820 [Paludibacteraceae bacterium]|nr:hypothetical protein [Paludibacteraceae bacterium]